VHESTIRSLPPPTCIAQPGAILLHDCTISGQYTAPPQNSRLYAMRHTILVIPISCNGQCMTDAQETGLRTGVHMRGGGGGGGGALHNMDIANILRCMEILRQLHKKQDCAQV